MVCPRTSKGEAALPEDVEGLGRGDLVHQMEIDVEGVGTVVRCRLWVHQVPIPDLVEDSGV